PEPVGYDPSIIPGWENAASESFAVLKLDPWRLRVMPGSVLLAGEGEVLVWER
ncbi:MAG: pyridoxamine 5'-phosphate oxidase family protein, partial [Gammaproteobacteria bacterium]